MALLNPGRAAAALTLALAAGGCGDMVRPSDFVESDPDQLLVHAVLQAGSDSAMVTLSRVSGGGSPVRAARVRLLVGTGEVVLREMEVGPGPCAPPYTPPEEDPELPPGMQPPPQGRCYTGAVPGGVRAGAEYRLEVELPSGERASGYTVVPFPPAVQGVADGERSAAREEFGALIALEPLSLTWTAPRRVGVRSWVTRTWPHHPGALCAAYLYRLQGDSLVMIFGADLEADSARVLPMSSRCSVPGQSPPEVAVDSVEVAIGITAYDSAYVAYAAKWENGIPDAQARAGLQGAYGVFGGAATTARRVRLVPQQQ